MAPTKAPGANTAPPLHSTKQRLVVAGLQMLLKHGYNDMGIQALLQATQTPKGSFYHHFKDKQDFALQVLDTYMSQVHGGMNACLRNSDRPPLTRVRDFFEITQKSYREEGYMGCLIGGLGQELSGVNEVFREKISQCFSEISKGMAGCLEEARQLGDIPEDSDVQEMAERLVDCWEGAALRSRLQGNPTSLNSMLNFYFSAVTGVRQRVPPAGSALSGSCRPTPYAPKDYF